MSDKTSAGSAKTGKVVTGTITGVVSMWALLSVDNLHDQPDNLVACWFSKPNLEKLSVAMTSKSLSELGDGSIVDVVRVHGGEIRRVEALGDTMYRLRQLPEGRVTDKMA